MNGDILIYILIAVMVILGYSARLLTVSGAIAAFGVGFFTVLGLGLKGLFILGLFFVSSSFWSKIKSANKSKAEEILVKGSRRDWQQVMANGGLAALSSALYFATEDKLFLLGFCICNAAANSDTWASEIGSMSKVKPFFIKTFKRVERGTSGAVSLLGTSAALLGSFVIACASYYLFHLTEGEFLFILILGFTGNVVDTLLGAFIQAGYQCSVCGMKTEKTVHCGRKTNLIKGIPFLNNDTVNFLSGLSALLLGTLIQ
ncbi:DUF92 domain-containing protein [Bacillus benzoevorans]|uniref:Uncharacterized protein (TIGR00297 family) n=1 Tax=Bacillus benzoevorans TaxID=1456 RepID=A0A7X0HQ69_9BACI|nr:DUF92 domain-containing protein [Bacillus benzoevorans]MBB6444922.1 uncharacterized protein (TIGR00297 family) [Bacillus benzoevorans]